MAGHPLTERVRCDGARRVRQIVCIENQLLNKFRVNLPLLLQRGLPLGRFKRKVIQQQLLPPRNRSARAVLDIYGLAATG